MRAMFNLNYHTRASAQLPGVDLCMVYITMLRYALACESVRVYTHGSHTHPEGEQTDLDGWSLKIELRICLYSSLPSISGHVISFSSGDCATVVLWHQAI